MQTYDEVPFADATIDQLRRAAELFGVETARTDNTVGLRAKIRTVFQGEILKLPALAPSPDMSGSAPPKPADDPSDFGAGGPSVAPLPSSGRFPHCSRDPKVRVIIQNAERDGVTTSTPITLGNNGEQVTVQRGIEVDLPYRFFISLRDAEKISYTQIEGEEEMLETRSPAHPYSVVDMPPKAEIAEWHRVMDGISIGGEVKKAA